MAQKFEWFDDTPLGNPGHWKEIFRDDFLGSALDLSKWKPNWFGPTDSSITTHINSLEIQNYDPANATVQGGSLRLHAEQRTTTTWDGTQRDWTSGMISSNGRFEFTYGHAEARVKLPNPIETWVGFWATGQNWPETGEIDILEILNDGKPNFNFWHGTDANPIQEGPTAVNGFGPGWHTFGAEWQAGRIDYFYNGVNVGNYTNGITSDPMYLIANHGLSATQLLVPCDMFVDYIRVWQRA